MMDHKKQSGFTLVEMIGVMAVIAILASAAAPRVFDAIEDAKISRLVQQVQTMKTAASKFYADTGRYPIYYTPQTNHFYHSLMYKDSANTANADLQGWNGPYVDVEPEHPIKPGALQYLINTNSAPYICDADGDGTTEGPWLLYRFDGMSLKSMEKVSNIIDGDGSTPDWGKHGLVKQYNENHTSIMVVCLSRT